ncbi:MAG: 50S ribosomal protein L34e [Candidatus Bathyarchaeales archaeon]|mgnify:CR=1 FL=1
MRRALRSTTKKRVQIHLPGNRSAVHFKKEKVKGAHCLRCGQLLSGIPRLSPSKMSKIALTEKKTERLFSEQICHNCLRTLIKQAVRMSAL